MKEHIETIRVVEIKGQRLCRTILRKSYMGWKFTYYDPEKFHS